MKKHVIICGTDTAAKEQLFAIFQQRCTAHNKPNYRFIFGELISSLDRYKTNNTDIFIRSVPDCKSVLEVVNSQLKHLPISDDTYILFLCDFASVLPKDAEVLQHCQIVTLD